MSNVNSTSSALSSLSIKTGMAGLVSGLDTDQLIESMTIGTRNKIDKEGQKIQKMQWQQTAYRNVTKGLKEFQSKYLDVLSKTNFRSPSLYNTVKATTDSTKISVTGSSSAAVGKITIDEIKQLATNETLSSGIEGASKALGGTITGSISDLVTSLKGKSIVMQVDDQSRLITFDEDSFKDVTTEDGFKAALQKKVDVAFGTKPAASEGDSPVSKVQVSLENGQLSFKAEGSKLTVASLDPEDMTALTALGMKNGQTDRLNKDLALKDLPLVKDLTPDENGNFKLTINSVELSFNQNESLSTVMNRINNSKAGVTMEYSSISDKITMTAKESGAGEKIDISSDSGNFMKSLGIDVTDPSSRTAGKDAILILDVNGKKQEMVRSSNKIDIDGVKIELLETTKPDEKIIITNKTDITDLTANIKSFVEDYNNMLGLMNGLLNERKDTNKEYLPLTDAQKKDMSKEEIEKWETEAKKGLLQNDPILKSLTSKMQTLMYSPAVKGGISLYDMGISTKNYADNGKLSIDEDKLKKALETRGAEVQELFTTKDTGIATQLDDIITGATKTSGPKGKRGTLIEKAGYELTMSDEENGITESIKSMNKNITKYKKSLESEEARLWKQFSALESALQQLNAQSSVLTQFSAPAA